MKCQRQLWNIRSHGCQRTSDTGGSSPFLLLPSSPSFLPLPSLRFPSPLLSLCLPFLPPLPSLIPSPFNPARRSGERCISSHINESGRKAAKSILVLLEVNMRRFRGPISCIFQHTELKGNAIDLFYDGTNRTLLCWRKRYIIRVIA